MMGADLNQFDLFANLVGVTRVSFENDSAAGVRSLRRALLFDGLVHINELKASNYGDTLIGGDWRSVLRGGAGNDTFVVTGTSYFIDGGAGSDTVSYEESVKAIQIDLLAGNDNLGSQLLNVENVRGSALDDRLSGSGVNNVLDGGRGDDVLIGNGGNDVYVFGRGYGQDRVVNGVAGNGRSSSMARLRSPDVGVRNLWFDRVGQDLRIRILGLPCYFLLSAGFTPALRARLNEKFNRGAENQAFLVETISGVETLKAGAVEPQWIRKWDHQLAAYVKAGLRTATLGTLANSGVTYISKLVTVATLWLGARLVIDGQLTVGQLIAFNMLAGNVAGPVMRLAQLWTDFQQVGISMQRLGDILNTRTEVHTARPALPPLRGAITLDQVVFRYRPGAQPALRGVSLHIRAGETLGIVGRSGSGKSTLTKLAQRLYAPEQGRVLIDGVDITTIDASSLRRQIGVVLQENLLFNRSIRDNIALADPGMPLQRIIQAAQQAGAHEFIAELPEGYDTMVGEQGATLSGGQRQRIAIARALLSNPRILILDEATSALDYESERIIQRNMRAIGQGRTVLIIAHRLSAVKDADRIIVMDRGEITEEGTHAELLTREQGHYAALYRMQQG